MKRIVVILIFLLLAASPAAARERSGRGATLARDIMGGAMAGSVVGFSSGLYRYGQSGNTDPRVLLVDSVYGLLGGAIVGTGLGIYEFTSSDSGDIGVTVADYVTMGALMGGFIGVMGAFIPYALSDDTDSDNFAIGSVGMGLGGMIGAGLGLGVAILDISLRSEEDDLLLSGTVGLKPETAWLSVNGEPAPALCVRVVELRFH